eukprot:1909535-Rhodomonas_salina.1
MLPGQPPRPDRGFPVDNVTCRSLVHSWSKLDHDAAHGVFSSFVCDFAEPLNSHGKSNVRTPVCRGPGDISSLHYRPEPDLHRGSRPIPGQSTFFFLFALRGSAKSTGILGVPGTVWTETERGRL